MSCGLRIVADENIPALEPLFGAVGELVRLPGRSLCRQDLQQADLLLVRSVTRVDRALLEGTPVRFVGTATIGTDHLDTGWLEAAGIPYVNAPGCNADAVVEYVISCLWHLAAEQGFDPLARRVGVVGAGNVGGRLVRRLRGLGMEVLVCDPPRAEREGGEGFATLEQVLEQADLISLHTPLIGDGPHPTRHLLDAERLSRLQSGAILINSGRGPVIDNQALLAVKRQRPDLTLVLDVWEREPLVDPLLAQLCAIVTPHIAGYSLDGKIRGTWMLYRAICQWLGLPAPIALEQVLPAAQFSALTVSDELDPLLPIRLLYDPYRDDRALRATLALAPEARALAFDRLRKQYPVRREFARLRLEGVHQRALAERLDALGFSVQMA